MLVWNVWVFMVCIYTALLLKLQSENALIDGHFEFIYKLVKSLLSDIV